MRLNLINFIQDLETTKVKRITGQLRMEEGRCALGICADEMIAMSPEKWSWGSHKCSTSILIDVNNPELDYFDTLPKHLGISRDEVWNITQRNDLDEMDFKENAQHLRLLLTDEEQALLKSMEQNKKQEKVTQ